MNFKEKYTCPSKKSNDLEKKEIDKIEISNDIFALCECLDRLTNKIKN